MQVLQLTDQQIAMLPPDQRASILILKEQISKSAAQWTETFWTMTVIVIVNHLVRIYDVSFYFIQE